MTSNSQTFPQIDVSLISKLISNNFLSNFLQTLLKGIEMFLCKKKDRYLPSVEPVTLREYFEVYIFGESEKISRSCKIRDEPLELESGT